MELNHCTESDNDEAEAREMDRISLSLSDYEPAVLEAKLDLLARRRLAQMEKIRHAKEALAKMDLGPAIRTATAISDLGNAAPLTAEEVAVFDAMIDDALRLDENTKDSVSSGDPECQEVQLTATPLTTTPTTGIFSAAVPAASVAIEVAPTVKDRANDLVADTQFGAVPYRFPWPDEATSDRLSALTDRELMSELARLVNQRDSDRRPVSYLDIRSHCCAISIIMNQRGMLPPAFRANRSLPKPIKGFVPTDAEKALLRDRQVIDVDWLHSRGKRQHISNPEFAELLTGDELNRELAERFAFKGWAAHSKAQKVLNLIPFDECQMAVLRSKACRDEWRNACVSMETTIDKRLRERAIREPGLVGNIEYLKRLWLADKIARHLGQRAIGQVYSWLTGDPALSPGALSAKLKQMRRRTS